MVKFEDQIRCPKCEQIMILKNVSKGGEGAEFGGHTTKILAGASYQCRNATCLFHKTFLEIIQCKCETPDYDIKIFEPRNKIQIHYRCKVCDWPFVFNLDLEQIEMFERIRELERKIQK